MRDDFTVETKRVIADRVARRCSRPECGATTSGPEIDEGKAVNVGVAAHITGASSGGPRYDASLTPEERSAVSNGIWLCQTCAKLVDDDELRFTVEVLRDWKARAEAAASSGIGKPTGWSSPSLHIELPEPVNPIGHRSAGGWFTTAWRFKVRLIARGAPLDVIEFRVLEAGVGDWKINEVFREPDSRQLAFPMPVERAVEFWVDAASPCVQNARARSVDKITLRVRDHTQPQDQAHELVIENPPIR